MNNRSVKHVLAASIIAVVAAFAFSSAATAKTRVGVLECNVSGGVGFIITSSKALSCLYKGNDGRTERYAGTIRKFGLDVGITGKARMVWGVIAPSAPGRGALAGNYAGASASASAGVGAGANALVGGAKRSFTLQPVSVQVQTGVNLTAGVSSMTLDYVGR